MTRSSVTKDRGRAASIGLVVLLLAGLLVATVRAESATADTAGTVVFGPKCPDVMVIAARGSGQNPQSDWTNPAAYRNPDPDTGGSFGAGKENLDLFVKLENAAPHLHFSLDPVQYPAIAAGWAIDTWRSDSYFDASVESGATTVLADIERTERNCQGGVKYLFTGYSQGAWVVHRALWKLAADKGLKQLLGKVVGVALFGDPKFAPFNEIVRDTKVSVPYYGVLALTGALDPEINVPKDLTRLTASYCFTTDPICQGPPNPVWAEEMLLCATSPVCKHLRYIEEGKTNKAATFLTPKLPPKSVWPRLTGAKPPAGTVGVPYEWTATVAPTARTKYIWTALAPPPGLDLSEDGVLSGCPTKAGTYSFGIKAQSDPQERYVTGTVTVTIKPGTSLLGCSSGTGTVAAWGYNNHGQLGNGSTTGASTPVQVAGLSGVTAIAASYAHSLALREDGTVWAWGLNYYGGLGNGSTTDSSTPVQVAGLSKVTAIAGGLGYSLALREDGTVWAWGRNVDGELGTGSTADSSLTPVQVAGLSGVTAIAGGYSHGLALRSDGTVWAWGNNQSGQLGNGTTTFSSTPVQVAGLSGASAIAAESNSSLALRGDGSVWAWGEAAGGLGDDGLIDSLTPVQVAGLSGVTAIAGGGFHSLALRSDGTVWAWGDNEFGQLGTGSAPIPSWTPVQVTGLSGVTAISAQAFQSLALLP